MAILATAKETWRMATRAGRYSKGESQAEAHSAGAELLPGQEAGLV